MFEDDSHDVRADSDHHHLLLSLRHRHVSHGPVFLRKHIHVVGCTTLDVKLLRKTCQLSVVTRCKLYSFIFTSSLISCKSLSLCVCARVRMFMCVVGSLREQASVCLRICVYMCMYMCLSIRLYLLEQWPTVHQLTESKDRVELLYTSSHLNMAAVTTVSLFSTGLSTTNVSASKSGHGHWTYAVSAVTSPVSSVSSTLSSTASATPTSDCNVVGFWWKCTDTVAPFRSLAEDHFWTQLFSSRWFYHFAGHEVDNLSHHQLVGNIYRE